MARRPRKRRRRHAAGAAAAKGPDCFSYLGNDLLRDILSRLTTRCAATLAAVSRNFHELVPRLVDRVDSITIDRPDLPGLLRPGAPIFLRRLAIDTESNNIRPSSFRPVLTVAAEHGISELSVRLRRRARLPKNVLSLRSLSVLALHTCAVPSWSIVACPCLRTLKLQRVAIHQDVINRVLASASRLETLEMVYCSGLGTGGDGGCTVESSSVRNLLFRPTLKQAEAAIRAPGLRTVTLYTRARTRKLQLEPAPEVRKAYLHIARSQKIMDSFRLRPFLDAGTKLDCLTLRDHAMMVLSSEYEDVPKLLVVYQDLRILSVSLDPTSEKQLVFLLKLLESCPNLHKFTLSAAERNDDIKEIDFMDHKERLQNISCLTTSLVQFEFRGFTPKGYQKKLIIFLLNQANKLKKLGLEFEESELAAVRDILSVRRAQAETTSTRYTHYYMELEYS